MNITSSDPFSKVASDVKNRTNRATKASRYTPPKMISTHCAMASEARCSKPRIGSVFHSECAISSLMLIFVGLDASFEGVSLMVISLNADDFLHHLLTLDDAEGVPLPFFSQRHFQ